VLSDGKQNPYHPLEGAKVVASARRRVDIEAVVAEIKNEGFAPTVSVADTNIEQTSSIWSTKPWPLMAAWTSHSITPAPKAHSPPSSTN
jgi:hypothetical protein